jgi:hypothetical protein
LGKAPAVEDLLPVPVRLLAQAPVLLQLRSDQRAPVALQILPVHRLKLPRKVVQERLNAPLDVDRAVPAWVQVQSALSPSSCANDMDQYVLARSLNVSTQPNIFT